MPAFSYVAVDLQGRTRRGVIEAEAPRQARAGLRSEGLVPLEVEALGADWAVRVDLIHETATERLLVLECDAAPMISAQSAFAASLAAANISRAEQLQLLLA